MIERLRVRVQEGVGGEFSSPELAFCADSYTCPFHPALPQWYVKDPGHSATTPVYHNILLPPLYFTSSPPNLPLWVHRNLFWQLSRDGNLHGSGMSHPTTASPKPAYRALWRVGDAVVGRGNADGLHQRVDIPARARTAHKGLLQKRLEEDLC